MQSWRINAFQMGCPTLRGGASTASKTTENVPTAYEADTERNTVSPGPSAWCSGF